VVSRPAILPISSGEMLLPHERIFLNLGTNSSPFSKSEVRSVMMQLEMPASTK
jgi:hypothetical protein